MVTSPDGPVEGDTETAPTKPKRTRKTPAKKPKAKTKPKTKKKTPAKKKAKAKTKARKPAAKKKAKGGAVPERSERLDMRLTKTEKAKLTAKAKRLRRTITSIVYEAIEKIR